ncbi:unnamed protein product, partial [Caretta caretta]
CSPLLLLRRVVVTASGSLLLIGLLWDYLERREASQSRGKSGGYGSEKKVPIQQPSTWYLGTFQKKISKSNFGFGEEGWALFWICCGWPPIGLERHLLGFGEPVPTIEHHIIKGLHKSTVGQLNAHTSLDS